jgi:hypothetical protein
MLSEPRDMAAAKAFFRGAVSAIGKIPRQVTSHGHDSFQRAIREVLGPKVEHRCSAYLNRRIEQDHRGVKQRYYPMLGFAAFHSAQRFCRAFKEIRQYFRSRRKQNQIISLAQRPRRFVALRTSPRVDVPGVISNRNIFSRHTRMLWPRNAASSDTFSCSNSGTDPIVRFALTEDVGHPEGGIECAVLPQSPLRALSGELGMLDS